ncbi:GPI mannosyltransferase 2 [Endogone sp. FLAS-F59071]|nr:GPI mannosyltransferase 2 [Endogone sp. FLAS-F59071]|eukprot:RUS21599.1 GPI mannosyltransferase 2 [Endogone sp. FLAS-F59071]
MAEWVTRDPDSRRVSREDLDMNNPAQDKPSASANALTPAPAFLSSTQTSFRAIIYLATLSRVLTWLLAYLSNLFVDDYDSASDTILQPLSSSPLLNHLARPALAVFLRWDAFYFLHIAEQGYIYEQEHAFFPLVPLMARAVARTGRFEPRDRRAPSLLQPVVWVLGDRCAIVIAGTLISNISFILAAGELYRLTRAVFPEQPRLAFLTGLAYIFTPSSMFMSAFYTESLFALLSFWGMREWADGRNWSAAVAWATAGGVRSNALVYAGFFVWKEVVIGIKEGKWKDIKDVAYRLFTTIGCSLVVLSGFAVFQWYGYQQYCIKFTPPRPWCGATIPMLYGFVQREYWNNGFLCYYEIKQIPNFLFAAPMIALSCAAISSYARYDWSRFLSLGFRSRPDPAASTSAYHVNARLLPFVYLWLVLLAYCTTSMHVQVVTRFFSSVPGVYWFVAEAWSRKDGQDMWVGKAVTRYFVLYGMVGVVLFANFFPPA